MSQCSTIDHENDSLQSESNQLSSLTIGEKNNIEESVTEYGEPMHGQSSQIYNRKYISMIFFLQFDFCGLFI